MKKITIVKLLSFGIIFVSCSAENPSEQIQEVSKAEEKEWVTVDRLNRRSCPSTSCGVVGQYFFREAVFVHERRDGWARVTKYYDAACENGSSPYFDEGNSSCEEANGITNGQFAEWVSQDFLSTARPPDPTEGAAGMDKLIASSDDYRIYKDQFVRAATNLINDGVCSKADFVENGGWWKSTNYRDQPVYFIYCGGSTLANKIYLNAQTGEIFR